MKNNRMAFFMIAAAFLSACNKASEEQKPDVVIGKTPVEVKNGRMSAEILHLLGQVSGATVSPDGKTVLYGVSYCDIALNKRNCELFTVNIDGTNKQQITHSAQSEGDAQWIKNGKKIAFIYDEQIWEMNPDGSNRVKISDYEQAIESFKYSPDGTKVLFISTIKSIETAAGKYPDLDKSSGRIIEHLMYKHWDEWTEGIPHPFVADYNNGKLSNIVDILDGEPYESPMRPWGGIEQLAWSPDSKTIAYTCRRKTGKEYAESTNSDIYLYNVETKNVKNLTEGMLGYDTNPQFSPDGKAIAWL
ncbi:MAG: peptidase S9, partial [Dysgonamonadaceae bacterium]|nr:peptidase S9 [Dysgonamonadaceae bacterium]